MSKLTFLKKIKNIIRVSNRLGPDQDRHSVAPDLGPNCWQRLSADDDLGPNCMQRLSADEKSRGLNLLMRVLEKQTYFCEH